MTPTIDPATLQLLDGPPVGDIARLKTDVFRERARYSPQAKALLATARAQGPEAVVAAARQLGPASQLEAGVAVDVLLSYRAVSAWQAMVDWVAALPPALAQTALVQEQLGLALNRLGRRDEAEAVLRRVIERCGPNSETSSLLGRICKDRWDEARQTGQPEQAERWLHLAIETYLQGFEADWRDAFPGINAITLMELLPQPDPRQAELLPVVRYAVQRRVAQGTPDYWDHATLLELAVLARNEAAAQAHAHNALAALREGWEAASTARTLGLIRQARQARGETLAWAEQIEQALLARAGQPQG